MTLTGEEGSTYREVVQFVHHNSASSVRVRNVCFATKTTERNVEIRRVSLTVRCNYWLYFPREIKRKKIKSNKK
jgi:hypoxanthine-guanine phosphoribosyltransferase